MKKSLAFALLASATILTGMASPAFAAGTSSVTNGKITFVDPDDAVDPVDPTDPENPVDTPDPNNPGTGQTGPLTLDVAPNLYFGEHKLGTGGSTYQAMKDPASSEDLEYHPYLQVSDRRGVGTDNKAMGWVVTVATTEFKNGDQPLKGAFLSFGTSEVTHPAATTGTAPAGTTIANLNNTTGATTIFSAAKDAGLGTWLSVYNPENVTLTAPTPSKGTFTATLTWTISAAPEA